MLENPLSRKRKSPDTAADYEQRPSPFERNFRGDSRNPSASRSSSTSSAALTTVDVYNGVLDANENGYIFCRPVRFLLIQANHMLMTQ
jgi:histone-lysine N-methyltransferase SUV39H